MFYFTPYPSSLQEKYAKPATSFYVTDFRDMAFYSVKLGQDKNVLLFARNQRIDVNFVKAVVDLTQMFPYRMVLAEQSCKP